MPELRFLDPQPDPDRGCVVQQVKKGRAFYGRLETYPLPWRGAKHLRIYWAVRRPDEVFYELDAWAVDVETITALRAKQTQYIGVDVTNGDRYLTLFENFTDKTLGADVLNYSGRTGAKGKKGALQWYLPRYAFAKALKSEEESAAITAAMLRLKSK
jgi:hypothetical protein